MKKKVIHEVDILTADDKKVKINGKLNKRNSV
jgi:hypothetical protein